MPDPVVAHFAAARPKRGEDTCVCCAGKGEHPDGTKCKVCDEGIAPYGQLEYCEGQEPRRGGQRRRRHWRQAAHQMMSVEELLRTHPMSEPGRYEMKARDLASHPAWAALDEPLRNGTIDPVYLSHARDGGHHIEEGQHRIVRAHQLGITHLPVSFDVASQEHRHDWDDPGYDDDDDWAHLGARHEAMSGVDDYGGGHRPLKDAPSIDRIEEQYEQVHEHPEWYTGQMRPAHHEGVRVLRAVRGKPEAPVTIYRASPADAPQRMHHGDWVTTSRTYAHEVAGTNGFHDEKAGHPWKIHKLTVPAKHLRESGSEPLTEYGYWGPDKDSELDTGPRPKMWWDGTRFASRMLDLYHRTDPYGIDSIRETGLQSNPNGGGGAVFFSNRPKSPETEVYGEGLVHVRVPEHMAHVDEEFPTGEKHYHVNEDDLRPEHYVSFRRHGAARSMSEEGSQWEATEPHGGHHIVPSDPHPEHADVVTGKQPKKREAAKPGTMSVKHLLSTYRPSDFDTWKQVHDNIDWDAPEPRNFVAHVKLNGVLRPIPLDRENKVVMNGHTRLLAADKAGVARVPVRDHEWMDPDDPDPVTGNNREGGRWLSAYGHYEPPWGQDEDVHPVDGSMRYHVRTHHSEAWPYAPQHDEARLYEFHRGRHMGENPDEHEDDEAWPDAARNPRLGAYYHASPHHFETGDMVEPGHGAMFRLPGGVRDNLVWFTSSLPNAKAWAREAPGGGHVYEVEPTGRHTPDSMPTGPGEFESEHPLRIVRKVNKRPYHHLARFITVDEARAAGRQGPWYHGTPSQLSTGDLIDYRGRRRVNPAEGMEDTEPGWNHVTEDWDDARQFGPHVYEVELTGRMHHDPGSDDEGPQWFRSKEPLRVMHQLDELGHRLGAVQARGVSASAETPPSAAPLDPLIAAFQICSGTPEGQDWEETLRRLRYRKRNEPLMHRGLALDLPPDVHSFVHDHFQSRDRQARAILDHLRGTGGLGMHWSTDEQTPRHFADWERRHNLPGSTKVILHASLPEAGDIETDPATLTEHSVFRHDNFMTPEHEIPMKAGAPVHVKGVTWYSEGGRKYHGEPWGEHHTAAAGPERTSYTSPGGHEYELRHTTVDRGERKPRHMITAHTPQGNRVGEMQWYGTTGTIHSITVADGMEQPSRTHEGEQWGDGENHLRRGLATAMWEYAHQFSPKPRHSGDRTTQGEAWARSVGGPGLRKKAELLHPFPSMGGHAGIKHGGQLGILYHATPYKGRFPDPKAGEWYHLGTRKAAVERAKQQLRGDYDLPEHTPTNLHAVRVHGKIYPHILTDEQANEVWGHGYPWHEGPLVEGEGGEPDLPSGKGYHIYPYFNETEDKGSVSYLVHHSAILPSNTEVMERGKEAARTERQLFDEATGRATAPVNTGSQPWEEQPGDVDRREDAATQTETEPFEPERYQGVTDPRHHLSAIPEYGREPEHQRIPDDLPEEEHTRRVYEMIDARHNWRRHMKRGLSLGHLNNESAKALGYYGGGHEQDSQGQLKYQPLPHEMYHVTTDLPGVRAHGLKTRDELNQVHGHGLGGGEDDTISLTDDHNTARNILRAVHEFHDVVNHRYTPAQMWEDAKAGKGADRPYHAGLARYHQSDWKEGDPIPEGLRNVMEGRTVKRHGLVYNQQEMDEREGHGWHPQDEGWDTPKGRVHYSWERPSTEDEKRENAADLYKRFATWRQHEGGVEDPLFFSTDTKALAAKHPSDFGLVHVSPHPGAQGYKVHALGEWRTGTGDALHVHHFERWHHPGTLHEAMATDWDEHYHSLPDEVHRGLYAPESHDVFTMPQSDEDIAHGLIAAHQEEQFRHHPDRHKLFGTHWTSDENVARSFAREHYDNHHDPYEGEEHDHERHSEAVPVVFHAERPAHHEIEHDERRLGWQNVDDYTDAEHEVPIAHGAPVRIKGVSWLHHLGGGLGDVWHRHDLREPVKLRAHDDDSPDDPNRWNASLHEAAGVSHWQHADCGVYAYALREADPSLRIGAVAGPHSDPAGGHALHWFAHDDTHAYDSRGKHPLPYVNVWDSASRNWFPPESHEAMGFRQQLDVDTSKIDDLSRTEREMLPAAHAHIRKNKILSRTAGWKEDQEEYDREWNRMYRRGDPAKAERGDRWHAFRNRSSDDLHRGIHVSLPGHIHRVVHDESTPVAERAKALSDWYHNEPGLGMHWTPHIDIAERAISNAANASYPPYFEHQEDSDRYWATRDDPHTDVIFHARRPAQRSVLRNRDELERHQIGHQYSPDEDEVPIKQGSPVRLTGISWKLHEPEHPNEPFEHHDFDWPVKHEAAWEPDKVWRYKLNCGHTKDLLVKDLKAGDTTRHPEVADKNDDCRAMATIVSRERRSVQAAIEHDEYEPQEPGATRRHWFENFDDDNNSRGHADVHEFPDHVELDLIKSSERGHGHASELLDHITNHFRGSGKPVWLNPMPADYHRPGLDEEALRSWYGRHGFEDDPHTEWMTHHGVLDPLIAAFDPKNTRPMWTEPMFALHKKWQADKPDSRTDAWRSLSETEPHPEVSFEEMEPEDFRAHMSALDPLVAAMAAWSPSSGIFAPTTGLDPLLFDDGDAHLRDAARQAVLDRLLDSLKSAGYVGRDEVRLPVWMRVYLAGGAVSEWAGARPNVPGFATDLDVLIGVDELRWKELAPGQVGGVDDEARRAALNGALRLHFNDDRWQPAFGGTWDLTGYVNAHAWDITALRPYAAYDLTSDSWAVRPPHSPEHAPELGYDPGPQARAIASEIRAVLHLPEPFRSQEARNIWDRLHLDRSRAFSPEGQGYTDPGNTIEKWLAYHPWRPLDKLRQVVFDKAA